MGRMQEELMLESQREAAEKSKKISGKAFGWSFAELRKEVESKDPEVDNIIQKWAIYREYLDSLVTKRLTHGSQKDMGWTDTVYKQQEDARKRIDKVRDEYDKKLDAFDKDTEIIKAKQRAVQQYKEAHVSLSTNWTFKKLEEEVKASDPKTKNIEQKRTIYRGYLKKIGTSEDELREFDAVTERVKKDVAAEKAKPSKFASFVSKLTSKTRSKRRWCSIAAY